MRKQVWDMTETELREALKASLAESRAAGWKAPHGRCSWNTWPHGNMANRNWHVGLRWARQYRRDIRRELAKRSK
jgi:hypothetical protein